MKTQGFTDIVQVTIIKLEKGYGVLDGFSCRQYNCGSKEHAIRTANELIMDGFTEAEKAQ